MKDGEADALVRELGYRGIGLAAPESVEAVWGEGTYAAVGVEIERVTTIELDVHGSGLHPRRTVNMVDRSTLSTIEIENREIDVRA